MATAASLLGWWLLILGVGNGIFRVVQQPDNRGRGAKLIFMGVVWCVLLQVLAGFIGGATS